MGRRQPHGDPSGFEQRLALLDHFGAGRRRSRGEGRDAVALLAAEQFVDRHAQGLALDVVEGDVERRNGGLQHAAALEILAAVHFLPQGAGLERIAADEELAVMFESTGHGLFAAGEATLAPAEYAFVGLDFYQQLVAAADPDGIGANGGDLHVGPCRTAFRSLAARGWFPPSGQRPASCGTRSDQPHRSTEAERVNSSSRDDAASRTPRLLPAARYPARLAGSPRSPWRNSLGQIISPWRVIPSGVARWCRYTGAARCRFAYRDLAKGPVASSRPASAALRLAWSSRRA